jgi:hypothetical protein
MDNEIDNNTETINNYLESLTGIKAAEPKDFFYSRLITRLENEQAQTTWNFPLKPVWMISTLAIFLVLNTIILKQEHKPIKIDESASIQGFANAYDQNISSY